MVLEMPQLLRGIDNRIRGWWQRHQLRSYGVREAVEADADFIHELMREGAASGHFSPAIFPHHVERQHLAVALSSGRHPHACDLSGRVVSSLPCQILVYGSNFDGAVGFAYLVAGTLGASDDFPIELLMASIRPDRRGQNHGRQLVDIIATVNAGNGLAARCYPASQTMIRLLEEVGFQTESVSPSGIRRLVRPPLV